MDGISFAIGPAPARRCSAATAPARPPPSPPSWVWSSRPPAPSRARRRDAAPAPSGAAPDELREPLREHADAAHGAAEPQRVRHAVRLRGRRRPHPGAGRRVRHARLPRPRDRQAVVGPEDPRRARQVADQPAGDSAARRADRVARSRHRRLGARPARALSPRARRHRAAGLAQHGRGRAAVRPRHHAQDRPHRGRRHAGAADRPLRPRAIWRRCSSTSPAAPARRGRRRDDHAIARAIAVFAAPRVRDGAAALVSAQLVLAARARPDLLAGGADADVGLPAKLRVAELRLLHAAPPAPSSAR